ncbi:MULTISPECIES: hypothetical protein [unclassified Bradyrhizobium]|uniref:hypothetical protein n=1 Tax=unclassified Bradyrhizobium TaxID=2631580 RepID=UPI003396330F
MRAAIILILGGILIVLLLLPYVAIRAATRSSDMVKDEEPSINITFDGCIVAHEKRPGKKKPRLVISCTKASGVRIN